MASNVNDDLDLYENPLLDTLTFSIAINSAPNSYEFTRYVHILVKEIKGYFKIQNNVHPLNEPGRYNFFLIQVSCCLREMGCNCIRKIMDTLLSEDRGNDGQVLLIDYLMYKLLTSTIIYTNSPGSSQESGLGPKRRLMPPTVQELDVIISQVDIAGLPANVNTDYFLTMLESEIKLAIVRERQSRVITSFNYAEITMQWDRLEKAFIKLVSKYRKRKEEAESDLEKSTNPKQEQN
ncbi:uncharacterized protein LOC106715935 [Papilio machaon]|uniref:uncharacterized protein LOC106715935 n=1 Tax=Papilio machaon TaxID=76193 RepID=UPI001E6640C6|nr:uncharacterized protein LOC106715935 [Papilio machaon]